MSLKNAKEKSVFKINHETAKRIRFSGKKLLDPYLDIAYLQAALSSLPGISLVRINPKATSIVMEYDGEFAHKQAFIRYLSHIPHDAYRQKEYRDEEVSPLTVAAKTANALSTKWQSPGIRSALSCLFGFPTISKGVQTLLKDGLKVEVLDATAVLISLLRKDYATANSIVALLGIGSWLEQWTENKSNDLLTELLKPQVETVWVERDAKEISVPFKELAVGDIVICGTGELIPVDGTVVSGEAAVNQSSITGESLPIHVQEGDDVLSGAVIEDGRIRIRASHVGRETSMARINRFLENSLRNPSDIQKQSTALADKLVPVTFGLGLGIFALTRDLSRAASALTVDYSCALKLAAPVAVKSGMHCAGKNGVLLKGGQALDRLSQIDTLVFDKTGTLTKGNLEITDVISFSNALSDNELLALAAGAEEHYGHPVARAVVQEAKNRNLSLPKVSQVDFIVAHGVSAYVNKKQILVGSRHFLEDDEHISCKNADKYDGKLRSQGKSILYIAEENALIGIIAMRDEIRPEAPETLKQLRKLGIKHFVMLTGDHKDTAKAICEELQYIDEVFWELKPEDKAQIVQKLQSQGRILGFAGDGVNDAPALLSANVGICMPKGADLARESAQVVLLEEDLSALVLARGIATKNQQILKNAFYSTISANSLIMLLATLGKLTPVKSALLHNLSTIAILGYTASSATKAPKKA